MRSSPYSRFGLAAFRQVSTPQPYIAGLMQTVSRIFRTQAPTTAMIGATSFELNNDFPPLAASQADYYSITNQWARMRQERETKTRLALEKAWLRAEQSIALAGSKELAQQARETRYFPIYGPAFGSRRQADFSDEQQHSHQKFVRSRHHVQAGPGRIASDTRRTQRHTGHSSGGRQGRHSTGYNRGSGLGFRFDLR